MIKVQVNYVTGEVQIIDVEKQSKSGGGGGGGGVRSVVAGTNVTVDNTDPYNPIVSSSGSGGSTSIPEYTTDPASPSARDAWVLRSSSGGGGGGVISNFIMGFPLTTAGAVTYTYEFKYRTDESTTVAVALT